MASTNEPVTHTSISQKIRSKELAHSMRFGAPKLRDLLRQKCRIRFKEARLLSFDNGRSPLSQSGKDLLSATIREELRELNFDIELHDRIFDELSEEAFAWKLFDQDEKETEFLGNSLDEPDPFFCPICQTTLLEMVFGHYSCSACKLKFKNSGILEHFQYNVLRKLVEHESSGCGNTVSFFAEPILGSEFVSLNVFCDGCDFYACFKPN